MISLSVIIVTKNRAQVLKHCFGSLASQTVAPKELIIINNSSTDSTPQIVKNFENNVSFPVKVFVEKKSLYPVIYNRGLKESTGDWTAFIDDDCVADPSWVESILAGIKDYPNAAAIVGNSQTYFSKNIFSLATWMLDEVWKIDGRVGKNIRDFTTLDNKNIAYRRSFIDEKELQYDEKRVSFLGAAEDADFGLQIQAVKGTANYLSKMIIFHKDPQSWGHFWKKTIISQKAFNTLYQKWGSRINFCIDSNSNNSHKIWRNLRFLSISLIKKILIMLLMIAAGFITNNFLKHESH